MEDLLADLPAGYAPQAEWTCRGLWLDRALPAAGAVGLTPIGVNLAWMAVSYPGNGEVLGTFSVIRLRIQRC